MDASSVCSLLVCAFIEVSCSTQLDLIPLAASNRVRAMHNPSQTWSRSGAPAILAGWMGRISNSEEMSNSVDVINAMKSLFPLLVSTSRRR